MTDQELAVLAFEGQWWQRAGAKEAAIVAELGLSVVRYYQLLARLIHREDALAAEPVLVNRLRRLAGARRRARLS